jgi:hypothetical protein
MVNLTFGRKKKEPGAKVLPDLIARPSAEISEKTTPGRWRLPPEIKRDFRAGPAV